MKEEDCQICGTTEWAAGKMHLHHVGDDSIFGYRRGIDKTIRICCKCHNEIHSIGQKAFEKKRGVNLREIEEE